MSRLIKISKLAKDLNINVRTLYNWKNQGNINFVHKNKRNYVTLETYNEILNIQHQIEEKVVIYCRVSSTNNKNNLQTQKERLIQYCMAKGYKIYKIVEEIGSGINDNREKLTKLLQNNDYSKIVVEHKDRLTRFGFNYIDILTKSLNKEIEVVNNVDTDEEDIIQDFVSIITSYCAKIYGKRRSKRKTEKLIMDLKNSDN
jgi:predicted site-specific integrase-resolvase